jgi:hypothetical protein
MEVSEEHVNVVNHWHLQEKSGSKQAGLGLRQYYAWAQELRPSCHDYIGAMKQDPLYFNCLLVLGNVVIVVMCKSNTRLIP